jgi:hypothetical protein
VSEPNRLWLSDSKQIVKLAREIIRQQELFQSRPSEYGERNRTFWFVRNDARRMLAIMRRAERRDERFPEPLPPHLGGERLEVGEEA